MTEDPSFWDWLWFTALDGIGGGLLGGAIAAWALSRTIRHERRLREDEQVAAGADRLQAQVAQAFFAVTVARAELDGPALVAHGWEHVRQQVSGKLIPVVIMTESVARQMGDSSLARDLTEFRMYSLEAFGADEVLGPSFLDMGLIALLGRLTKWLEAPTEYSALAPLDFTRLEDEIV